MKKPKSFPRKYKLAELINSYFDARTAADATDKITDPPTLSNLILHLGFTDRDDFELYESQGKFCSLLKQARCRLIAYYESRLLLPAPAGAIFALKALGWEEKPGSGSAVKPPTSIKIKLIETGPKPASSEKAVSL